MCCAHRVCIDCVDCMCVCVCVCVCVRAWIVGVLCVSYMNVCAYGDLLDVGLHVYLCVSYVYGVCIMPPVCVMVAYAAQRVWLWGADFKGAS